jgi:hypothetical protein
MAEISEFAEYKPVGILDWSEITGKLAGQIYSVGAEKQQRRAELDELTKESERGMANPYMTNSQTYNTMTLKATQQGRDLQLTWHKALKNGEMTYSEYKGKVNNLMKSMGDFATASKDYDKTFQDIMQRQADQSGSGMELVFADQYGKLGDIANSEMNWDLEGNLYHKNLKTGEMNNMAALNRGQNAIWNRVDPSKEAEKFTETWKSDRLWQDVGREGWYAKETWHNNPKAALALNQAVQSMTSVPKNVASILVDSMGITPIAWTNQSEYNEKRNAAIENIKQLKAQSGNTITDEDIEAIDMSMIQITRDGENFAVPKLNKKQQEAAEEFVRNTLISQIQTKIEGGAKQFAPNYGRGGGSGAYRYDPTQGYAAYATLGSAWINSDAEKLNAMNPDFRFKWNRAKRGFDVSKRIYVKGKEKDPENVVTISNARDLAPYIFKIGTDAAGSAASYDLFDAQKEKYLLDYPNPGKEFIGVGGQTGGSSQNVDEFGLPITK